MDVSQKCVWLRGRIIKRGLFWEVLAAAMAVEGYHFFLNWWYREACRHSSHCYSRPRRRGWTGIEMLIWCLLHAQKHHKGFDSGSQQKSPPLKKKKDPTCKDMEHILSSTSGWTEWLGVIELQTKLQKLRATDKKGGGEGGAATANKNNMEGTVCAKVDRYSCRLLQIAADSRMFLQLLSKNECMIC